MALHVEALLGELTKPFLGRCTVEVGEEEHLPGEALVVLPDADLLLAPAC
jgi:hypothetical protein